MSLELDRVHRALDHPIPTGRGTLSAGYTATRRRKASAAKHGNMVMWILMGPLSGSCQICPELHYTTGLQDPFWNWLSNKGYTYCCPLAVTFRKATASFTLHTLTEPPALFFFLGVDPIQVSDWLIFIPRPTIYRQQLPLRNTDYLSSSKMPPLPETVGEILEDPITFKQR